MMYSRNRRLFAALLLVLHVQIYFSSDCLLGESLGSAGASDCGFSHMDVVPKGPGIARSHRGMLCFDTIGWAPVQHLLDFQLFCVTEPALLARADVFTLSKPHLVVTATEHRVGKVIILAS
jgi:hypothetical protein